MGTLLMLDQLGLQRKHLLVLFCQYLLISAESTEVDLGLGFFRWAKILEEIHLGSSQNWTVAYSYESCCQLGGLGAASKGPYLPVIRDW